MPLEVGPENQSDEDDESEASDGQDQDEHGFDDLEVAYENEVGSVYHEGLHFIKENCG